ncbi:MAG: substrate-binding domain-containing protein [Phycisphaeraceae bacterium JB051]
MKTKYLQVANLIKQRLDNGVYAVHSLPGERKIASEMGVSYVTARQAIQHLVGANVLNRKSNGRLKVNHEHDELKQGLRVAMVFPFHVDGGAYRFWYDMLKHGLSEIGGTLIPMAYTHWDDPQILRAINGDLDGIFIVPPEQMPPILRQRIGGSTAKVVTLWHDLTDMGIPCLDGSGPENVELLIEHLAQLGHQKIDCFNVQPLNDVIEHRIECWRKALKKRGLTGQLHNRPVRAFEWVGEASKDYMNELMDSEQLGASAVFCTVSASARGVYRAAIEHGCEIGRELGICTFGELRESMLLCPSLTTVDTTDKKQLCKLVNKFFKWMQDKDAPWLGPLVVRPQTANLFIGESTIGSCKVTRD